MHYKLYDINESVSK